MFLSEIGNSDLAERLLQVGDQIVRVFKADGQADQVGGHFERGAGHGGVGHGARMLDQGFHATQRFGQGEHFGGSGELLGRFETGGEVGSKGSATKFTDDDYYWTLGKCLEVGDVTRKHMDIMDKFDPNKRVALLVDEWGTWWDEEPGTVPGHLYQQNTMRDAMVAALSLNVFHDLTDRVKMTNIAQIANVLQSMVLTKDNQMVLTPTYYVFKMYVPHQDAKLIPLSVNTTYRKVRDNRLVPVISATASEKDGKVAISLVNTDLNEPCEIDIPLGNIKAKNVKGEILTSTNIADYNDFGQPEKVTLKTFNGAKINKGSLKLTLPAKSIVTLQLD